MTKYRGLERLVMGAGVRHPLYPELGLGTLIRITPHSRTNNSSPVGKVSWPTGQVSTHSLLVLKAVT